MQQTLERPAENCYRLESYTKWAILRAWKDANGSISETAKLLCVSRDFVVGRLKKYGYERKERFKKSVYRNRFRKFGAVE